jgi:hypothetical protein
VFFRSNTLSKQLGIRPSKNVGFCHETLGFPPWPSQHVNSAGRAWRKAAGVVLALLAGSLTGVQSHLAGNGWLKGNIWM